MNMAIKPLSLALVLSVAGIAAAQQAPPTAPAKSNAQMDAGEPRANTSPIAGDDSAAAPAAAPTVAAPHSGPRSPSAARAPGTPAAAPKGPGAADRLSLGTATVTGDHEQPKVMYIVPWKSSNIGDLNGKPMNSLLDEALAPVDRDEFKREVAYYDAMHAPAPQNGAAGQAAKQGEK